MRVLHVTDHYLPRLGGIETQVHDLVAHQRAAGTDARVLTTTPAGTTRTDPAFVHRLAETRVGAGDEVGVVLEELVRLAATGVPVTVHAHVSVLSPLSTAVVRRAVDLGLPAALTVHSQWNHLGPLPATAGVVLGLRAWPVAWSTVSGRAAEPIVRMLGPRSEVHVVGNAVVEGWWREAVTPGGDEPVSVVSVMRLARTKRPMALARMLREVRESLPAVRPLRATIVGEGPLRPQLERYLRRHEMDSWVDLPGRLDREQVREVLARSHVFVAPAHLESFGIAALEARCAGLPVVASARSGVGEFVRHGENGLLTGSDRAMTAAVVRLLVDDVERGRMTRRNLTTPSGFDWPRALEANARLYARADALAAAGARGVAGRPEREGAA